MSALRIAELTACATEQSAARATPCTEAIEDPQQFLIRLFRYLSDTHQPISRAGLDIMMDSLFDDPQFAPLLTSAATHQQECEAQINMSELFKAHWRHIIIPAWNQHAEISRVCHESS